MRFGFASWLALGVLLEQAGGAPGGSGGGPPAPPAPAPPAPAQPFAVFHNQEQFDERMGRAQRSYVREQFGEDPDTVKQRLARLKELETAEAERTRAELTATQRLEADLAVERARVAALTGERDAERFRSTVSQECARLGIRNLKYAQFVVAEAAEALPDGQQLDPYAYLKDLVEKPEYKGAFGIEVAAPTVQPAPVTTSPQPGTPPPAPPAPGTSNPAPVDAMGMNPAQFRAHLDSLGAGGLTV